MSSSPPPPGGFVALTVTGRSELTADSVALTFAVPAAHRRRFSFRAGQHLTIRFPGPGPEARRTYSICSSEQESGAGAILRIGVKELPGGLVSRWLTREVRVGDRLQVGPPIGGFSLPPGEPGRRIVAVAAGSGITPVLSIVSTVLAAEPAARVDLVCGNRTAADVMFLEDLHDLKDRYRARLTLRHVLSREQPALPMAHGRIDGPRLSALLGALGDPLPVDEWLLCGPLPLLTDLRSHLAGSGVPSCQIHSEVFYAGRLPPAGPVDPAGRGARLIAVLGGRTSEVTVQAGQTLLEALLTVRPDAPFACTAGVCGSCRARLLRGQVNMGPVFALEAIEISAGAVLACQARPASSSVEVDFD